MGLQINLHAKLKEYFGFDHFKGNQEAIIKNVLAGNNTFNFACKLICNPIVLFIYFAHPFSQGNANL